MELGLHGLPGHQLGSGVIKSHDLGRRIAFLRHHMGPLLGKTDAVSIASSAQDNGGPGVFDGKPSGPELVMLTDGPQSDFLALIIQVLGQDRLLVGANKRAELRIRAARLQPSSHFG